MTAMTAQEKIAQALSALIDAEIKDEGGAGFSASTHRNAAIVLLASLVPGWETRNPEEKAVVESATLEMTMLHGGRTPWEQTL